MAEKKLQRKGECVVYANKAGGADVGLTKTSAAENTGDHFSGSKWLKASCPWVRLVMRWKREAISDSRKAIRIAEDPLWRSIRLFRPFRPSKRKAAVPGPGGLFGSILMSTTKNSLMRLRRRRPIPPSASEHTYQTPHHEWPGRADAKEHQR